MPPLDLSDPRLHYVDLTATERLLARLRTEGVPILLRGHEPLRHARHLAAIWQVPLAETVRATLMAADGRPLLVMVPADRKIGAPRLRAALGIDELRVLRGDRGVGRIGWEGLPPPPGALPAVPELFGAPAIADDLLLDRDRLVIALDTSGSIQLAPSDFVRVTGAHVDRFAGTTRLLPAGGMVEDDPYAE